MDIEKTLLPEEVSMLTRCENILTRGLQTFWDVGGALDTIRVGKLYRATHSTFEDYCHDKWGMGRSRSNQLRQSAKVLEELKTSTIVEVLPDAVCVLPLNEAQVRPLTSLPNPEQRREAWGKAVKAAGGTPTATQVSVAVAEVKATYAPPTLLTGDIKNTPEPDLLLEEVLESRKEARFWKETALELMELLASLPNWEMGMPQKVSVIISGIERHCQPAPSLNRSLCDDETDRTKRKPIRSQDCTDPLRED